MELSMTTLKRLLLAVSMSCLVAIANATPMDDAFVAHGRGDYAQALKIFRPLAEQGNAKAQSNLGVMYNNGQGVTQDYKEAVKWYGLATAQRDARGFYTGVFGGAGRSTDSTMTQSSVVYATDFLLPVNVSGDTKNANFGIAGFTAGHEWALSNVVKSAIEVEGFYFWGDQKANLSNKNRETALPGANPNPEGYVAAGDHTFKNSFDMKSFAFMLNGVVSFDTKSIFSPYVGGGVGLARVQLDNGNSIQTCKKSNGAGSCGIETSPTGGGGAPVVNHFNTDNSGSDTVFAAQAKLGVRAKLSNNLSTFVEYRHLHLNSASYKFGNTDYPDHLPTDKWKVESDNAGLHYAILGMQYAF
jgi:opacity protein-like surface antigen